MSAVELQRVYASDALGPAGRTLGKLRDVSLTLAAELVVVEGRAADGSWALAESLAGRRAPARGRVLVLGEPPHRSAALRARIASFLPAESKALGANQQLAGWLDVALPQVAARQRLQQVLEQLQLNALAQTVTAARAGKASVASLHTAERRALELAVCLSLPSPLMLVLVEPFATLAADAPLQQLLRARADAGSCVVVITRDGSGIALADRRLVLNNGELQNPAGRTMHGLAVELSDEASARRLAAKLLQHPAVQRMEVELSAHGARLKLQGQQLPPLARALVQEAAAHGAVVQIQPLQGTPGTAAGGSHG